MNQRYFTPVAFRLRQNHFGRRETRVFPFAAPFEGGGRNRPLRPFLVIVITLAAALLWAQTSPADESLLRGPGKTIRAKANVTDSAAAHQGVLEDIAAAPVLFYQRFLSRHWGQSCAYYPSCSNYALLAIRKHGAVIGTMIAFDRLQHETNEARTSPLILIGGQTRVYDPLENNDYWWYMNLRFEPIAPASAAKDAKR
ncbi:MAG: hypothetical protein C0390_07650 [Syntrophus sp. (in: bacteria)]|nr:hypothetical protein [Syntrophus sp. (in: bacteria)]